MNDFSTFVKRLERMKFAIFHYNRKLYPIIEKRDLNKMRNKGIMYNIKLCHIYERNGQMYKLIIADDVEMMRKLLAECIEKCNLGVEIAGVFSDGEYVIEYLKEHDADIIITDIKMPGKTGLDVAKYVYNNRPQTKVIIISAYDEFDYAKQAIRYGVFDYLSKSIDVRELSDSIKRAKALLDNEKSFMNEDTDLLDIDRACFWERVILYNEQIGEDDFRRLYPKEDLNDTYITTYTVYLENYKNFRETKWGYESERLIEAIYGAIRLTLDEMGADEVDFINLGDDKIQIVILHKESINIEIEKVSGNLYSLFGLNSDYNNIISCRLNEINDSVSSCAFNEDIPDEPSMDKTDEVIKRIESAKKYITDNIEDIISREDVARFAGYSESHFSKLFRDMTGVTVSKYIQNERIKKVTELLSTDMKIKDIAKKTGYHDSRRMRCNFKIYVGMTPDEYRRKIIKREENNS